MGSGSMGKPLGMRFLATKVTLTRLSGSARRANHLFQGGYQTGVIVQRAHSFEPNPASLGRVFRLVVDVVVDLEVVGNKAYGNYENVSHAIVGQIIDGVENI